MAETATATLMDSDQMVGLEPESTFFNRRIEFHQERKPFSGFGNNNSNGFKLVTLNPTTEPHVASGLIKKIEKSTDLYENGLDLEASFEISFRRIGAGLRNLGNTCFLNSVLQCLTYTEPLAAYLQSGKHQSSCRTAGFCALCAIQKHVSRALQSTGRTIEPKDLVCNLRRISRNFRNASQEDAHEYMVHLLESMHKCCLPSGVPSESPSAYEKSLVHKIFGGRLCSQVKCLQCSYCSNKFDPFLDLSLEIAKANSVDKALAHFTAKEQLDGGAKEYQCQQCKQKVKAVKQLTIDNAPYVLAVHLKRFGAHALGKKIDKKIEFGPTLDLKPFVTGPNDGNLKYTLYGVLVHAGWSTRSGHYYCFVRTSSGMWYALDDNEVSQVSERRVLEQKAYMLFYVRNRKKVVAKKSVNTMQKENIYTNGKGNAAQPLLNHEPRGKIQNGAKENKLKHPFSKALSEGDFRVSSQREDTSSEQLSKQNTVGTMSVDNVSPESNTEDSLLVSSTKSAVNELSTIDVSSVGHKGDSCSTVDGSGESLTLGHAAKNIAHTKSLGFVEEQNTERRKDSLHMIVSRDSAVIPPMENGKKSSCESAKNVSNSACKIDNANSEMCTTKIKHMGTIAVSSNKDDHALSSQQSIIEEYQVGGPSVITTVPTEKSNENQQKMDAVLSEEISGIPATIKPVTNGTETVSSCKVRRKLKRQINNVAFRSNTILGLGLGMRKKKLKRHKHKKNNCDQNTFNAKNMLGNGLPSNTGQSVPKESSSVLVNHNICSQQKNSQCGSACLSSDVTFNEFQKRIVGDGTIVSSENQPSIRQPTSKKCDNSDELRQTNVVSMLTSGLNDTPVARWGETDIPRPPKSETVSTGTAQIGYVGDEWDEEYDKGKRKKIRISNITFGGPNLFQETATKNLKKKNAKIARLRKGNQPFRI